MTVKQQVLGLLAQQPGLTDGELEELLGKIHTHVNRVCHELEAEGLIRREKVPGQLIRNYLVDDPASDALAKRESLPWTPEELLASVYGYWQMLQMELRGERFVKSDQVEQLRLGPLAARTHASVEYRMQNISAVLESIGRPYIQGYKPAKNVGAGPRAQILAYLAELDSTLPDVVRKLPPAPARPPAGNPNPERRQVVTVSFLRDKEVVSHALERANGFCECCHKPAPFIALDGKPFLEVHHVRPLADGGPDTPENVVAICPNCHRELHYGAQAGALAARLVEFLASLQETP